SKLRKRHSERREYFGERSHIGRLGRHLSRYSSLPRHESIESGLPDSGLPAGARGTGRRPVLGTTFIEPGCVGDEYFMTKGHFHAKRNRGEYYVTAAGSG